MVHAWQCRTCDTRNAPSLLRCRACGAAAAAGRPVLAEPGRAPNLGRTLWEMLATTAVVAVWLPVVVVGLFLVLWMPPAGIALGLLVAIVWLLWRIAEGVART
jgi:hypothetical protein